MEKQGISKIFIVIIIVVTSHQVTSQIPKIIDGDSVEFRKVIYKDPNMLTLLLGNKGHLKFKVCVDRKGMVVYAHVIEDESTIKESRRIRKALNAINNYRWEPSIDGALEECGEYLVSVDNFGGLK